MNLREYLMQKVDKATASKLRRGFEIIGDIVIIDLPDELMDLKEDIVKWILSKHKHVKTIMRKTGEVSGEFRIAKYEIIYGGETETIVKEFGCRFKVDPTKVYYSSRLSGERERIARLVKPNERVLVMFAGVGPYAILIAKLGKPKEVVGVELNPEAVKYFRENVKMNKVENIVKVIEGDVREIVPKLEGKFDRIVMPAPYNAEDFIYLAVEKIKKGGFIHFYTFAGEEEVEEKAEKIKKRFSDYGVDIEIIHQRECGNFAPRVNRYVFDILVK